MQFPQYTRSERIADAIVHVIGIGAAIVASIALASVAVMQRDLTRVTGLGVYTFGLLAMLGCSALYNMTRQQHRKAFYRRLDHAAIFLMIAGSYTPFALTTIGGRLGTHLLIFVWLAAAIGIVLKMLSPTRWERWSIAAYLLLGWSVLVVLRPLIAGLSTYELMLLVVGGVLYSLGVVFHKWTTLPYHNAVWHLFVLAAATCHFLVVLTDTCSGLRLSSVGIEIIGNSGSD